MAEFWENLCYFLESHKVAAITIGSILVVGAASAGGYGLYKHFKQPEVIDVQITDAAEENQPDAVDLPQFKTVSISSESVEKDITIYISDENDECITGADFSVKLIKPDDAKDLHDYVESIQNINKKIEELTGYTKLDTGEEKPEESDDSPNSLDTNPLEVTISDESGEVVDQYTPNLTADSPIYQLYCDKEVAIQAYAMAIRELPGDVYHDDDQDGVINEKDLKPGDYVALLMYDTDVIYDPEKYETAVNVKDKVEYKVVKEITKKVVADKPSEDGQKKEAVKQEATLKDTVEFVESSKKEKGSGVKSTTSVKKPTSGTVSTAKSTWKLKSGKATVGKTVTSAAAAKSKEYTYKVHFVDEAKKSIKADATVKLTVETGKKAKITPDSIDGYVTPDAQEFDPASKTEVTFVYKKQKEDIKTFKITIKCVDESSKEIHKEVKEVQSNETFSQGAPTVDGYSDPNPATISVENPTSDQTITIKYKKKESAPVEDVPVEDEPVVEDPSAMHNMGRTVAAFGGNTATDKLARNMVACYLQTASNATATTAESKETATLDLSYDAKTGKITVVASVTKDGAKTDKVKISGIKLNDKDIKAGESVQVTANGDYTLKGVVTYSDGSTENISVVYTVSGVTGEAGTAQLYDTNDQELYLDEACTKKATVADYKEGATYYYKTADYTYYGWQTINGLSYYYDKNGNVVTGTQVIQGVQYNFGSDGALVINGVGIDVSKYQSTINWAQAKSAVKFAIVRCGYRGMYDGALHEDPYFYKNMSGAKSAGVSTGIYIYSTALNEAEAVEEASLAVAMANKAGGCSYPIYIDMEDSVRGVNKLSNAQRNAIITAFCSTVQNGGYKAGVYANKTWMTKYIDAGSLPGSCYIWVAQYNTSCTYSGKYSMWQYSSKGSVPGIKGNVDMNKSFF